MPEETPSVHQPDRAPEPEYTPHSVGESYMQDPIKANAMASAEKRESIVEALHNTIGTVHGVLMPKEQVVQRYGYNGDLLAIISLPREGDDRRDRKIGIIDYGNFTETDAPYVFISDGKPIGLFGKAESRYLLAALNYTSHDHLATFYPLHEGDLTLGRNDDRPNFALGLTQNEDDNMRISRKHVTITLSTAGITVRDHSTNGTILESST